MSATPAHEEIPHTWTPHPVTGVANPKLGIWLFLASEIMLFGALFSTYVLLRAGAVAWPSGEQAGLNVWLAMFNTFVLIASSVTMVMAWAELKMNNLGKAKLMMAVTLACACIFLVVKYFEYTAKFSHHIYPKTNTFYAIYFTITGLHGLHILGGIAVIGYFLLTAGMWKTHREFYENRIECVGLYWHFVDLVWIFLFPILYLTPGHGDPNLVLGLPAVGGGH